MKAIDGFSTSQIKIQSPTVAGIGAGGLSNPSFQQLLDGKITEKAEQLAQAIDSEIEKGQGKGSKEAEEKRLRELCQDFESLLIHQMIKSMRSTIDRSQLIPESPGRQIWEGMLDEEYSKEMAKKEELGLATMLYEDLSRGLGRK
ncbi:rod-binding protein [Heliorestis convoluta]|uniref:Flagellar biosynthesis protein FlgJ, putative n=1 Tax=Heliorestis convoluta TaxID=356322 RepID=A0A5Q2N3K1_9FIRM|nr:rod-binding protein [Heliorestis convoluta]QGG49387.1 flagellar biosynthesis protein FlgJ, putative [Heliorestis convoluta]